MLSVDQYTSAVYDLLIEELGEDFDFYLSPNLVLDPDLISQAIDKGFTPREYLEFFL